MSGFGLVSWVAGALQLMVPSYALRLVRRFGTHRVGWYIVTAFASLAILHLLGPTKFAGAAGTLAALDVICAIGSVLLVIGMGHMETLIIERDQAAGKEQKLRDELEQRVNAEKADLMKANQELLAEINRREEIERSLGASEAQYRFLFTENPQPMWILDRRSCRFLAVNAAAQKQYGFSAEEFAALTGRDLVPEAAAAGFLQDISQPCPGSQSRGLWQHYRKDGTLMDVEISAVDLDYGDRSARLILASDVTGRRRQEREARQAQKMEVVSQVAGGVAEHFNNLLVTIDSHASALLDMPHDLKSAEQLAHISAATSRAMSLMRQLLAAGGRQVLRIESLDLNSLIRSMNPMLHRLIGLETTLETALGNRLPSIQADRHLIEHIIVNLVLNARNAMTGGGTLTLSTTTVRAEDVQVEADPDGQAGIFVRLSVQDTGCGMTPEVQAHLFEPFFTTADSEVAMGLGLASVYGAVKQHSGWIEFSSEPGEGTEFRILFPCPPEAALLAETEAATRPQATILLVEGEDRVRSLARSVLNWCGYRVIEADCAATALILWNGEALNIDLLLTSVNLPGDLSGHELADRLRQTRPNLKIVYASEACADGEPAETKTLNGAGLVLKPYRPQSLLEAVQAVLRLDG